jgi:DGQHR domain-containing protein
MAKRHGQALRKTALRLEQNQAHPLYLLSLTAEELVAVAEISRLSRSEEGKLLGYQREEVKRHIQDIVEYLNGDGILLPNSLVVAFTSTVRFRRSSAARNADGATAGTIRIPLPRPGEQKPGWVVDGQQRTRALLQSKRSAWPVPVNAFIADEIALQRDQFLRVNNTRPLPRGLITELLPEVSAPLPRMLAPKKVPSALCDLLNRDLASPFCGLIKRASTPPAVRKNSVVADASVVQMLEESLTTPSGCLFPYHNIASGETDFAGARRLLVTYWSAVRDAFPGAWGKPPAQSRLMHGTGIRSVGRLMDRMVASFDPRDPRLYHYLSAEIQKVAPFCRWTSGRWEELGLDWREVQNVPRHLKLLSNLLVRVYLQARGGEP